MIRKIRHTAKFKRDYKREARGQYREALSAEFLEVLSLLADDLLLPEKHCDHPLTGKWADHRDCHIKPDMVLIYYKKADELWLVRLGSHSELGL